MGYGKYVIVRHENGLETVYAHLSKQLVAEDQYVEAGSHWVGWKYRSIDRFASAF